MHFRQTVGGKCLKIFREETWTLIFFYSWGYEKYISTYVKIIEHILEDFQKKLLNLDVSILHQELT